MRKKGKALREAQAVLGEVAGSASGGVVKASAPPLPEFAPVPRKYRHDGWTPERQKAFIEALADTGCVTRAAAMVNMAQTNCYALRRAPGAEGFRKAWEAALDFGLGRLKDIAFERAIEGQLFPVFKNGRLVGFERRKNDALLMFCIRHYGTDANGKRTTINYFSTKAVSGAGVLRDASSTGSAAPQDERAVAAAEASTTTVRTVIGGAGAEGGREKVEAAADALAEFEGLPLDDEAHAAIAAALEACAARAREAYDAVGEEAADYAEANPNEPFVALPAGGREYRGALEPPAPLEEYAEFVPGEMPWEYTGAEVPDWVPAPEDGEGGEES
jgi:hypothetical protein